MQYLKPAFNINYSGLAHFRPLSKLACLFNFHNVRVTARMTQVQYKSKIVAHQLIVQKKMQIYFQVRHKTISQIRRRLKSTWDQLL